MKKPNQDKIKADAFDKLSLLVTGSRSMRLDGYKSLEDATWRIVHETWEVIISSLRTYADFEKRFDEEFSRLYPDWRGTVCLQEEVLDVEERIKTALGITIDIGYEDTTFRKIYEAALEAAPEDWKATPGTSEVFAYTTTLTQPKLCEGHPETCNCAYHNR